MEKELIIQKYGLVNEKGAWYSDKENSHKHLIVRDDYLQKTDTLGLLFSTLIPKSINKKQV